MVNSSIFCARRNGSFGLDRLPMGVCWTCAVAECMIRRLIDEAAAQPTTGRRPEPRPDQARRYRKYSDHE
jgi:hypothetical protein